MVPLGGGEMEQSKENLSETEIEFINLEVQRKLPVIFGPNLVFGFIFGSLAKGYVKRNHDIDVFICLRQRMPEAERLAVLWLRDLHTRNGMEIDVRYPIEIVTLEQIEHVIEQAARVDLRLGENTSDAFDKIVWIQVLADRKSAFVGDHVTAERLRLACEPWPAIWHRQVTNLIEQSPPLTVLRKVLRYTENLSDDPLKSVLDGSSADIPPKGHRLKELFSLLRASRPARNGLEAYMLIANNLNMLEDSYFGMSNWSPPRTYITGAQTDRLYPPQPDNFEMVPGWPGVTNMVHTKEYVFISKSGAIEVQRDDGSSERGNPYWKRRESVVFEKLDFNGDGVWSPQHKEQQ